MALEVELERIAKHRLGDRLDAVTPNEAHRILPEIWPIIKDLVSLTRAIESGDVVVKDTNLKEQSE